MWSRLDGLYNLKGPLLLLLNSSWFLTTTYLKQINMCVLQEPETFKVYISWFVVHNDTFSNNKINI